VGGAYEGRHREYVETGEVQEKPEENIARGSQGKKANTDGIWDRLGGSPKRETTFHQLHLTGKGRIKEELGNGKHH